MLRYAISDGQFALGHQSSTRTAAAFIPHECACHSERSEEPLYFAAPQPLFRDRLLAQARDLASRQVDFFLLREPDLPAGQLATLARELLAILTPTPTRLLLRSRSDVAAATGAHGVHLPSTSCALKPAQVRTVYAHANLPPPVVSLSCHTPADIERARTLHPDLILFGPVFGKTVANHLVTPPIGLEALSQACRLAAPIPVLALGGITDTNTPACLQAGAAGIAAIRLFLKAQLK